MKIMRAVDKKIGKVVYYKYKINLPKRIVEESGLLGKNLEVIFDKKNIVIKKEK